MARFSSIIEEFTKNAKDKGVFREKTLRSLEWYRNRITTKFGNQKQLAYDFNKEYGTTQHTIELGWFFTFRYVPKNKENLPYYDRHPLVLILKRHNDGFTGLNMHYLKPIDRAYFMDKLYDYEIVDPKYKTTKLNINYKMLQHSERLRFYKPCIKKYLWTRIGGFFAPIYPEEWDIMLFLPTDKFINEQREEVWQISKEKY